MPKLPGKDNTTPRHIIHPNDGAMTAHINPELPSKPDSRGHPVPPGAVILDVFQEAADQSGTVEHDYTVTPNAAAANAQVLAWRYTSMRTTIAHWIAVMPVAVLLTVVLWNVDQGRAISTFLGGIAIALIFGRRRQIAVGAHWFSHGKHCVAIYELTHVLVWPGFFGMGAGPVLRLKDRDGVTVAVPLRDVQTNRQLWDYLYLGIVHSVAANRIRLNNRARRMLQIDPGSPTVGSYEQDPRG